MSKNSLKNFYLFLFLLFFNLVFVVAYDCANLQCDKENKTCVSVEGSFQCVDYCSGLNKILLGGCSLNGEYCNPETKGLEKNRCDICGCPLNYKCLETGECKKSCVDGTLVGECSVFHAGMRCNAEDKKGGELIRDYQKCGEGISWENIFAKTSGTLWLETFYDDFINGDFSSTRLVNQKFLDLVQEGTVFASSNSSINEEGFLKGGAGWVSASPENQYVGVEWSTPKRFNKIEIIQPVRSIYSYRVQYIKDGEWTNATSLQYLPYYSRGINTVGKPDEIQFESVVSTSVRIFMPKCAQLSNCRISQIKIYNTDSSIEAAKSDSGFGIYTSKVYNTNIRGGNTTFGEIFFDTSKIIK